MSESNDYQLQEIRRIVAPIAREHGIEKVSLFGSRARGDNRKDSDYDFVISKGKITGMISYLAFVNALEDALGTHVDVVTDTSEDKKFLDEIREDEVAIYEQT